MAERLNDGGPAFPSEEFPQFEGMSLRDYFAGQALAGICANLSEMTEESRRAEKIAEDAYTIADAILRERQR